jgi:hypothetical protein
LLSERNEQLLILERDMVELSAQLREIRDGSDSERLVVEQENSELKSLLRSLYGRTRALAHNSADIIR